MTRRWNGQEWVGELELPPWAIFTGGNNLVEVTFITEQGAEPSSVQVSTLEHLPGIAAPLLVVALGRMRQHYNSVRPKYAAFARRAPSFMGDPDIAMPASPDAAAFARLHELQGLFLLPLNRDGLSYVGFSFRPTWEPEHGLGLMTHGIRVLRVGNADVSFALDAAEDDLDTK